MVRPTVRIVVLALTCTLASGAMGADLDAQQQQVLAGVQSHLKTAQANLKAAEDGAGPADQKPSASKAKLALSRSAQARSGANAVAEAIKDLPADNADVKATRDAVAAVISGCDALEARLTGGSSAGGSGGAPGGDASGGVKLDYKQEKVLKDAQYYLREMDGWAGGLEELVTKVHGVENADTIDHRNLVAGMSTIEKARNRQGLVTGYLKELPADGAGVKPAGDQLTQIVARIDKAEATLKPIHERLQKLVDPATYPDLDADVKRLQELAAMYRDPIVLEHDPLRAVEPVKQAGAARAEFQRVVNAYGPLIQQQTEQGKRVEGVAKHFAEQFKEFADAAVKYREALPGLIQADVDDAMKLADQAVAQQNAAFFNGGIPQRMEWAQNKLTLLESLDANSGAQAKAKLDESRAQLKGKEASLRELIVTTNDLPSDRYAGDDRKDVEQRATEAWKQTQADAQVLAVRIPSQEWERETMWRLTNTTWYRIDRSKLQAQLLVKHDGRTAVIRPINLWIDHMKGDARTAFPMDELADELPPQRYLLIEKIR